MIREQSFLKKSSLKQEDIDKIISILSGQRNESIPENILAELIPQRVFDIATNRDNLEVHRLGDKPEEISILVIEKDYPQQLTAQEDWNKWQEEKAKARKSQKGQMVKILPNSPNRINRLHAKFNSDINAGTLALADRVLMTCKLRLYPDNNQALYVGDFDGETHQGIGQDFYKNTLPSFCKNLGLQFIVGKNNAQNISFFKETLGRYTVDELKPEYQATLFPGKHKDKFFTIQFLNNGDVDVYVAKNT